MSETVLEYKERLHSHLSGKDTLTVLSETPAILRQLTESVPDNVLRHRPAPEKWSVMEIAAHLADVEIVIGWRTRLILGAEDGVPILGYDQDRWVVAGKYDKQPLSSALDAFTALRRRNLELYRSLTAEQWNKYGLHSERGEESVRDVVKLNAGHDLNHLEQIRRILS